MNKLFCSVLLYAPGGALIGMIEFDAEGNVLWGDEYDGVDFAGVDSAILSKDEMTPLINLYISDPFMLEVDPFGAIWQAVEKALNPKKWRLSF